MSLQIDQIRIDGGTQSRASINEATVTEYAEAMADPDTVFPPVIVYHDGRAYWLADGFHRLAAWRHIGRIEIPADVRQGDRRRAILHSVAANSAHGLRRTNDDKRRAVLTLLEDEEWSQWSDREIARRCAVSPSFVGSLRTPSVHRGQMDAPRTVERGGTVYQQNTANIGSKAGAELASVLGSTSVRAPARTDPEDAPPVGTGSRHLSREALEEDLVGALEELTEARKRIAKQTDMIADLKRQVAELSHSEHGRIIGDLQERLSRETVAKGKKMNELAVEARKLRAAEKRIAELERELAASREREVIAL